MATFSQRLTSLRESQNLSKAETARRLDIPVSTYSNYEYGNREPDFETLNRIAKHYHVTVDYLLGNDTPKADSHPYDLADDEPLTYHGVELPDDLRAYYKSMADAYIKQHKGDNGDA